MFAKITLVAAATTILLSTASATFAAPKHVPEPIYFSLATGEQG